jgi:hypothetical protein
VSNFQIAIVGDNAADTSRSAARERADRLPDAQFAALDATRKPPKAGIRAGDKLHRKPERVGLRISDQKRNSLQIFEERRAGVPGHISRSIYNVIADERADRDEINAT